MRISRGIYRGRQFWWALFAKPTQEGLAKVREVLTPAQQKLFFRLKLSEQAHAIAVLDDVRKQVEPLAYPHDLFEPVW